MVQLSSRRRSPQQPSSAYQITITGPPAFLLPHLDARHTALETGQACISEGESSPSQHILFFVFLFFNISSLNLPPEVQGQLLYKSPYNEWCLIDIIPLLVSILFCQLEMRRLWWVAKVAVGRSWQPSERHALGRPCLCLLVLPRCTYSTKLVPLRHHISIMDITIICHCLHHPLMKQDVN